MSWRLTETDDLDAVLALCAQVFDEPLTAGELQTRSAGQALTGLLLGRPGEAPVGFALCLGQGPEAELWRAGVIPARRRQGGGTALLRQVKEILAGKGYSRLTVNTFNRWDVMLVLLLKHGFRITATEYSERWKDMRITLVTELRVHREIRFALTEVCNFKCLFCHNEGLGSEQRAERPDADILAILTEATNQGFSDITLTGGEPLLRRERLYFLLDGLGRLPSPPALTLISNGALLDAAAVERLCAYPGEKKVHVSLHASDPRSFARLTGTGNPALFERVTGNIRAAAAAGLKVKVNCVLVREGNHDRIVEAVELARSLGAAAIKFIDLLVLPQSPADYSMYYDCEAILADIGQIADPAPSEGPRRHRFLHRQDTRFHIEVQKCTCALGCGHCRELRDRTFSSDMHFHPCLVRHKSAYPVNAPSDLASVFKDGDRVIDGYAFKFKDSSPTLIEKTRYVAAASEFLFAIDCHDRFREFLAGENFVLGGKRRHHHELYWPRQRSGEWERYERVLKLGWPSHDQSKLGLNFTDQAFRKVPGLGLEVKKRFLEQTGPVPFKSEDAARRFLDRLDFCLCQSYELDIEIWRRGGTEVSLSLGVKPTVRLIGDEAAVRGTAALLAAYPGRFEGLQIPYYQYLQE